MENTPCSDECLPTRRTTQHVRMCDRRISRSRLAWRSSTTLSASTFVTEDSDDPHRGKPFFPCTSEHNPDARAIAVVATRRRDDANPSQYVCQFIVMAAKKN